MRLNYRRYLSYLLLATYAGISLLGEGLHSLVHEAGHHHGLYVVDCPSHGCEHAAHHDADCCIAPTEAGLEANDGADSHICEICQFLFQAVAQPAEIAAPIDWQPLIVVAASRLQPIYTPTSLGPQAPRGPPLLA